MIETIDRAKIEQAQGELLDGLQFAKHRLKEFQLQAAISGGKQPYKVAWSSGTTESLPKVKAGTYQITITDALGATGDDHARGIPVTLFYDAQGRQVDAHFGLLNAAALESRLRQLRPSR